MKKQQTRRKVEPVKTKPFSASSRRLRECLEGLAEDEQQLASLKDSIVAEGALIAAQVDRAQEIYEAMATVGAAPDEWLHVKYLSIWASRRSIGRWVSAGELEGRYFGTKLYVRPRDFFAVQRSKLSTEPPVTALNQQ